MYTNSKALSNGYSVRSQTPIDDRLIKANLTDLRDLTGNKQYTYYEGMLVYVVSEKKYYAWTESVAGEIVGGYTYTTPIISGGITYSGRTFNFVESAITNQSFIINKTWTELKDLKDGGNLYPGQTYCITDRFNYQSGGSGIIPNLSFFGDDRGIVYVQALTANTLSQEAIRVMAVPITYHKDFVNGLHGVWNTNINPAIGDIAIWGGQVWVNTSGTVGNNDNDFVLSATDWLLEDKVSNVNLKYIDKQFSVLYDFDNDWFEKQWDGAGNIVGVNYNQAINYEALSYNPCDVTDWNFIAGRENSSVFSENQQPLGVYNNSNDGYIISNKAIKQVSKIINNANTGNIINNTGSVASNVNNGAIRDNKEDIFNLGIDVEHCISDQVTNNGNNSFFEIDITGSVSLFTPYPQYQKQVLLKSTNSTETITTIAAIRPESCRCNIDNGVTVTFAHNVLEIFCEGGIDAVLNGTNGDWIELEKDYKGKYRQINIGTY